MSDNIAPQTVLGGIAAQLRFDAAHYSVWRITFLAHCEANELAEALFVALAPTEEARRALLERRDAHAQASAACEADDGSASSSSAHVAPAAVELGPYPASVQPPSDVAAAGAKKAPSKKEAAAQK